MTEDIKDQESASPEENADHAEQNDSQAEAPEAQANTAPTENEAAPADESADESHGEKEVQEEEPMKTDAAKSDVKTSEEAEAPANAPAEKSGPVAGVAAFFDHPEHLLYAASQARDAKYENFDAMSPFPIHGMDDAMGLGRSWIPWVTFSAGVAGLCTAIGLQFGIMTVDWPMIYGGRPFAAWPSFVPIMFELTVLFAGLTTVAVMLIASGCFRKPLIIDRQITNNRFALWIAADDKKFDRDQVVDFMKSLNPTEIRTVRKDGN